MNKKILISIIAGLIIIAGVGAYFVLSKYSTQNSKLKTVSKIIEGSSSPTNIKDGSKLIETNGSPDFKLVETRNNLEIYHKLEKGVNCYIVKPKGNGPFPAFVLNHGGYGSAELFSIGTSNKKTQNFVETGNGIFLAEKGYVSIACDYTHKDLDKKKISEFNENERPGASEENIKRALNAIEILKNINYVNKSNIFMLGNSMGGFLTVGVAQKSKDLKAAIVIVAGIKDGNPVAPGDKMIEMISAPEELVKDISCPILMLNGDIDDKVNIKYPKHLKNLLDINGKTSKLIIYPNVGNDLLRAQKEIVYSEVFKFINEEK